MEQLLEVKWVELSAIKPNPNNRNKHKKSQIDELIEQIKFQGWRHPLIVSNQSGLLVVGHGRLMAARKMKLEKVPVSYQDFDSFEKEYAFAVADNAVASWSELDLTGIHMDLPKLEPFEIKRLGIEDFQFEPKAGDERGNRTVICPDCGLEIPL